MEGLIEGRIIHYVLPNGDHRPAIVVNVWQEYPGRPIGYINATVFPDWGNDGADFRSGLYWATSIQYSEAKEPGTWHWIEKV